MKKRILSLLLALVMLVGLLPTAALAADGSGSVDVYIIGRDELITYQQIDLDEAKQIDVSSYSSSTAEGTTALHAIVAALRADDLQDELRCTGGYITQIGDLVAGHPNYMSGWMYKLNNVFPDVGAAQSSLKDGDEIVLFWEQGVEGQQYCQFREGRKATVKTGEALVLTPEVTLLDTEDGLGKELAFDTLATGKYRMMVYVDGLMYPERYMGTAKPVSLYFSTPGTHIVTAKVTSQARTGRVKDVLTTPVCVVTVTGDALPSAGSLKTLELTDTSSNKTVAELTLKDGVSDYYLNVDYGCKTLAFHAEFDETASANKAYLTTLYENANENILGGMPMLSNLKVGVNNGKYLSALLFGENTLGLFVQCDPKTHAYRPIYLHVNRSTSSPNAQMYALDVKVGTDELCTSAKADQIAEGSNGAHLRLFYQKADGSTASCTSGKPVAGVQDYTVYVPYEAQTVDLLPVVEEKGTCIITDENGNICDAGTRTFTADTAHYTFKTTSSNQENHETYTVTLIRRPNVALTGASIDCGKLWLPGVVPGYNNLTFFITDTEAETCTITFAVTPGSRLYLESIAEENLISDGKLVYTTPRESSRKEFKLIVAGDLDDGSIYSREITVSLEKLYSDAELVELVTSPSQHMLNVPYDTSSGFAMLSAFGGYMTLYFKNPIQNDPANPYGMDFYVLGNPNYPNVWSFSEPAQIYVAQDKDGDGEPDKWYALAGSEHYEDTTYWDYEITYTNEGNRKVRWDDNYGNTGYVCGLSNGTYFPKTKVQTVNSRYRTQYQSGVLKLGGILVGPIKSENMIHSPITIFGYGDCYPASQTVGQGLANPYRDPGLSEIDSSLTGEAWEKAMTDQYGKSSHYDGMDISWAVDEDGNPVYLDEISFVRAMSAINVDSGAFSEKSPELGIYRLPDRERREQDVGVSNLPDQIIINGETVDLSAIHSVNGQATATVYLAEGEQSAAITVEAGDRNVILGNRYRKTFTYDTVAETGRLVRIITQDGEKAPNILVLNIQRYDADHAAAEPAETLIDAIGEVTAASGDAIRAARKAYDALTDEQKALVSNYQDLLDAEARYRALTAPVVPVTPSKPSQKPDTGSTLPFTDVFANSWFYDGVKYACEKGFMNGTGSTTFSPDADTTRGMIVTILARMEGVNTSGGATWYTAGREWAMENGISDGTNMTGAVTREQLAAILYRYAKQKGYDVTKSAALTSFTDADTASSYAVEAMQWAVASGLIQGSGSRLSPKATASRAQVATILMRFMELYAK